MPANHLRFRMASYENRNTTQKGSRRGDCEDYEERREDHKDPGVSGKEDNRWPSFTSYILAPALKWAVQHMAMDLLEFNLPWVTENQCNNDFNNLEDSFLYSKASHWIRDSDSLTLVLHHASSPISVLPQALRILSSCSHLVSMQSSRTGGKEKRKVEEIPSD